MKVSVQTTSNTYRHLDISIGAIRDYHLANVVSATHVAESVGDFIERKDLARKDGFDVAFIQKLKNLGQQPSQSVSQRCLCKMEIVVNHLPIVDNGTLS